MYTGPITGEIKRVSNDLCSCFLEQEHKETQAQNCRSELLDVVIDSPLTCMQGNKRDAINLHILWLP